MPNFIGYITHLAGLWHEVWLPVVLVLIFWCFPTGLVGWWLKAQPMRESELKLRLTMLVQRAGFQQITLNVWPVTRRKRANAMVSGFFRFRIDIADYFIRQFKLEELEFILAHELGHVKRKHIWKRRMIAFLGIPPWVGLKILLGGTALLPAVMVVLVYLILYYGVFHQYISRRQELEADEYSLELGISPAVAMATLSRLGRRYQWRRWYLPIDWFLAHPARMVRVKNIMRVANIQD